MAAVLQLAGFINLLVHYFAVSSFSSFFPLGMMLRIHWIKSLPPENISTEVKNATQGQLTAVTYPVLVTRN